jgi:hypothetical protein
MLVGGGDEKSFSDVFVSIGRMLVCLHRKSWLIKSHGWVVIRRALPHSRGA